MSAPGTTPGPWFLVGDEVETASGDYVCHVGGGKIADGYLIAAAPDLYDALVAALLRLAHLPRCHRVRPAAEWAEYGSASFENCSCEIVMVKAALAKSRGES